MRQLSQWVVPALLSAIATVTNASAATAPKVQQEGKQDLKEWTVLVFLNGHNNLDYFGSKDINEMEQVGSTDQMNIVVQWASLANGNTKRLYVTQDADANKVSSVPVEEMSPVDMGDYRNLVEFIRWGAKNFPPSTTSWTSGTTAVAGTTSSTASRRAVAESASATSATTI